MFAKTLLLSSLDVTLGYSSTFFGSYMVIGIISFIKYPWCYQPSDQLRHERYCIHLKEKTYPREDRRIKQHKKHDECWRYIHVHNTYVSWTVHCLAGYRWCIYICVNIHSLNIYITIYIYAAYSVHMKNIYISCIVCVRISYCIRTYTPWNSNDAILIRTYLHGKKNVCKVQLGTVRSISQPSFYVHPGQWEVNSVW